MSSYLSTIMSVFARRKGDSDSPSERTPLLSSPPPQPAPAEETAVNIPGDVHSPLENVDSQPDSDEPKSYWHEEWVRYAAILLLCAICIVILVLGLLAPSAARTYAREATQFNLSRITVKGFTLEGVEVGVEGDIRIDASRAHSGFVRLVGRMGTAIAKKVSTEEGTVYVHLPDYGGVLLGTTTVPAMVIDIRNGHTTRFNFTTNAKAGSLDAATKLAEEYFGGRLDLIKLEGRARLKLRSGILSLGRQMITETVTIENPQSIPDYDIKGLQFGETKLPSGSKVVTVGLSVMIHNPYEVQLELPQLEFSVIILGCDKNMINVAMANSSKVSIEPLQDIKIQIAGLVPQLPKEATHLCPGTSRSPLDSFLDSYLHGNSNKVYVSGRATESSPDAPQWLVDLLQKVNIPVSVPGHPVDNLIQSFKLEHVNVKLPSPGAKPGSPESAPGIGATIQARVKLPQEVKFPVNVTRMKADANLSYLGEKFGEIHIKDWVPAKSHRNTNGTIDLEAEIDQVPLNITNYGVFEKVIQRMVRGLGREFTLGIDGTADVEMGSSLGMFAVRGIPAHGNVTIYGLPDFTLFQPRARDIVITNTTETSISMIVSLIFQNPTSYQAEIPYANILIFNNGHALANASVENTLITPGLNIIEVKAVYDPFHHGGTLAVKAGEDLLSEYISGHNTTITLKPHEKSFPSSPGLSKAFSKISITLPAPKFYNPPKNPRRPEDDKDDCDGFRIVDSAVMHVLPSAAEFILRNPIRRSIIINSFTGDALYNGSKIGSINYSLPFAIKSKEHGKTITPWIPVDWSVGSVGYDAMMAALGDKLKIQTVARCRVVIGEMTMWLRYNTTGVGAHIRLL